MKNSEKIRSIIIALTRECSVVDYFEELCWMFKEYETAVFVEEEREKMTKNNSMKGYPITCCKECGAPLYAHESVHRFSFGFLCSECYNINEEYCIEEEERYAEL